MSNNNELLAVTRRFVEWNEKYPSNHIFSHEAIIQIAKELDDICADAKAAIDKADESDRADGISRIAAERKRQIEAEGWTAEHDMQHDFRVLALAGACYALAVSASKNDDITKWSSVTSTILMLWPWSEKWWKPSDNPIRNLEKAGALIAAAIDRIQAGVK